MDFLLEFLSFLLGGLGWGIGIIISEAAYEAYLDWKEPPPKKRKKKKPLPKKPKPKPRTAFSCP